MKTSALILIMALATNPVSSQSVERWMMGSLGAWTGSGSLNMHYSMGEVFVNTLEASNMFITLGFQQPNQLVTSVVRPELQEALLIYPNPADALVHIEFENPAQNEQLVRFFDRVGRCVFNKWVGCCPIQVDVTGFPPGLYLIRVQGVRIFSGKVLIY